MEVSVEIPFQQLVKVVKALSPVQKAKLRKELNEDISMIKEKEKIIESLLNGPVYTEADIRQIEENRKSLASWRTKS